MSSQELMVDWDELPILIQGLSTGFSHQVCIKPLAIPLIVVPGIMGSRLKHGSEKVWDPDAAWFMFRTYGMVWQGPRYKKQALIGDHFDEAFLEPYEDDEKHNEGSFGEVEGAAARGWGGVAWTYYGELLKALETSERLNQSSDLVFPVYGFGYNWTDTNRNGGLKLRERITQIITECKKEYDCEKVILITHSMGGLVARAACKLHAAEAQVLAVLHGVQPVTGSPAAYWRMKAGFERKGFLSELSAWVLGTNGKEVTAVLGNIPGGLELLPNQFYSFNRPGSSPQNGSEGQPVRVGITALPQTDPAGKRWLRFVNEEGVDQPDLARPSGGDPYTEIYSEKDQYWRLVIPEYLSPGADETRDPASAAAWPGYLDRILRVKAFHTELNLQRHSDTEAFYGSGYTHLTSDIVQFELNVENWKDTVGWFGGKAKDIALSIVTRALLGPVAGAAVSGWSLLKNTEWYESRGGFKAVVTLPDGSKLQAKLLAGSGRGDGTVPESSAAALRVRDVPYAGIEHSDAYKMAEHSSPGERSTVAGLVFDFIEQRAEKALAR